ncbi:TIGR03085 family metal-binding protein [Actinocorallia lasiicapitis]
MNERSALCSLLEELGAAAPTLCGDWTTADLAAHLIVRERRLDAAPGILISSLASRTERIQDSVRDRHTYSELVDLVRNPPALIRWVPPLEQAVNTTEFFVHHEDVRRAQQGWEPRDLSQAVQDELWKVLIGRSRLLFRNSSVGILLRRTDRIGAPAKQVIDRPTPVELSGAPAELLMYAFGRKAHALVSLDGKASAVTALGETSLEV